MEIVTAKDFCKTYSYSAFAEKALKKNHKWFPVHGSPTLAGIIGCLITDGHIQTRRIEKHTKYEYIGFFSDNYSELEVFNKKISSVFGTGGKIRKWGVRYNGRSTGVIISNAAMARVLTLCGSPPGEKVSKKFEVPAWILQGDKETQAAFLRSSFSCDGTIFFENRAKRWRIKIVMYKQKKLSSDLGNYLESLRRMLHETFQISTTNLSYADSYIRKKDNEKMLGLTFYIKTNSMPAFAKEIGFDIIYKNLKLQKANDWVASRDHI